MKRRDKTYIKYFSGTGIDVGCGNDRIIKFKDKMSKMRHVRCWDISDGDGELLHGVQDYSTDFVHSSHSLEHMRSWENALRNWLRVVKSGGYVIVCVPDWELYEHYMWPSRFNSDHKWAFTLDTTKAHSFLVNLSKDKLETMFPCKVQVLKRIEEGYDWTLGKEVDQTMNSAECAIEFVLKKV